NVETQSHEPDSMLSLYRRLLKLRAKHEILRRGAYEAFGEIESDIFVYSRWLDDQHVFVALNFSATVQEVTLPHSGHILCCTHPVDYPDIDEQGMVRLRPFEGVLVECQEHSLR
ncbi:MAG TPA: DUF3459 domain-containing protein, partial [Candidatus Saccharimonas sp.]|nr:DUF3459 domain-containing protein [Candidatus Saccharimonas sp.]